MRTRARIQNTTLPAGQEVRVDISGGNAGGTFNYPAFTYTSLDESMQDELPLKRRSGACIHSRVRTWYATGDGLTFRGWFSAPTTYNSTVTGSWLYKSFLEPQSAGIVNLNVPITAAAFDWKQSSYDAMQKMREEIDDGLLGINFLAELAETGRSMHENAKRRFDRAEHEREKALRLVANGRNPSASWWGVFQRRGSLKTRIRSLSTKLSEYQRHSVQQINKLARRAATANLMWQFVVKPTVSDAKKLAELIDQFNSRLAKLIQNANKRRTRHYARPVDNLITLPGYGLNTVPSLFGSTVNTIERRRDWLSRPKYHASMLYTYDATALQGQFGKLRGLLHAIGADRPASTWWEAVPYSFVIDWFVNIGDMIRSVEDHTISDPLPIVIHDFSSSLKYGWRISLRWNWNNKILTDVAFRSYEYYERRRDSPSLWDSLSVHSPTLNQAGLGLSLIKLKMDGITGWKRR